MPKLVSRNLASADYDSADRLLTIEFKNGSKYIYADVDESIYEGLLAAPSKGKFFISEVRERYRFKRIA